MQQQTQPIDISGYFLVTHTTTNKSAYAAAEAVAKTLYLDDHIEEATYIREFRAFALKQKRTPEFKVGMSQRVTAAVTTAMKTNPEIADQCLTQWVAYLEETN